MSEYQYYEFQAIDRPLGAGDIEALRALSTRARITATSFTNSYDWGGFRGDPLRLMERWFDLHLYLSDWGTRRFMMRLPKRLVDQDRLRSFLRDCEFAQILDAGENLILDVFTDDEESGYVEPDDGAGWLTALAPLRAEMLRGDMRMLYLLWLDALEYGRVEGDEFEPLTGIGPLSGGLEAFAEFFRIDSDLVRAAAETSAGMADERISDEAVRAALASIPEGEKTELLHRLAGGDPYVGMEVQNRVRKVVLSASGTVQGGFRRASKLRSRAAAIREEREAAQAKRREAERVRKERQAEEERRARLDALRERGEAVWREVEEEIIRRDFHGYDRAAALLYDLRTLAEEAGTIPRFFERVNALRLRHARKKRFIERLAGFYG